MTDREVDQAIRSEIERAAAKYGCPTSSHEGLGVLTEELRELEDAIRANAPELIRFEAIQVAAVATRIAYAMSIPSVLERSGCKRR